MKKIIVVSMAFIVSLTVTGWVSYHSGLSEGIDMYHQMCYNGGGIVINEQGQAVVCKGVGTLSEKEIKQHLTS